MNRKSRNMYMIFSRKNNLDFVEYFEVCETSKKNAYSSLSNKRDDHGTFTSPKVTLITLLLASITHTRGTRRAQKFSKIKDQNSKLALK